TGDRLHAGKRSARGNQVYIGPRHLGGRIQHAYVTVSGGGRSSAISYQVRLDVSYGAGEQERLAAAAGDGNAAVENGRAGTHGHDLYVARTGFQALIVADVAVSEVRS